MVSFWDFELDFLEVSGLLNLNLKSACPLESDAILPFNCSIDWSSPSDTAPCSFASKARFKSITYSYSFPVTPNELQRFSKAVISEIVFKGFCANSFWNR